MARSRRDATADSRSYKCTVPRSYQGSISLLVRTPTHQFGGVLQQLQTGQGYVVCKESLKCGLQKRISILSCAEPFSIWTLLAVWYLPQTVGACCTGKKSSPCIESPEGLDLISEASDQPLHSGLPAEQLWTSIPYLTGGDRLLARRCSEPFSHLCTGQSSIFRLQMRIRVSVQIDFYSEWWQWMWSENRQTMTIGVRIIAKSRLVWLAPYAYSEDLFSSPFLCLICWFFLVFSSPSEMTTNILANTKNINLFYHHHNPVSKKMLLGQPHVSQKITVDSVRSTRLAPQEAFAKTKTFSGVNLFWK